MKRFVEDFAEAAMFWPWVLLEIGTVLRIPKCEDWLNRFEVRHL